METIEQKAIEDTVKILESINVKGPKEIAKLEEARNRLKMLIKNSK